jgi:multisubunit Na+/H+ antiporter MnhB subunit
LGRLFWSAPGLGLTEGQLWKVGLVLTLVGIGHLIGALVNLRRRERAMPEFAAGAVLASLLVLALVLAPQRSSAFIYFQF